MNGQLSMFGETTLPGTASATSSPASEDGPTPSGSRASRTKPRSGREVAPASPSRWQDAERERLTSDTFGPLFTASSPSGALQSSLESKLRARMACYGSPEYVLTWKGVDMPSGPPICRLRASARRTSGSGSTGWQTPSVADGMGGHLTRGGARNNELLLPGQAKAAMAGWPTPDTNERGGPQDPAKRRAGGHSVTLQDAALVAGWPTPTTMDHIEREGLQPSRVATGRTGGYIAEVLAGWATPTVQDAKNDAGPSQWDRNSWPLNVQAASTDGEMPSSSPAETGKRGALNPAFPRWLMGFPPEWDDCAPMATRSSRRWRPSS